MSDEKVSYGEQMPDWYVRVNEELQVLRDKVYKLNHFVGESDEFPLLSKTAQTLLFAQREAMYTYLGVLKTRLALYKDELARKGNME